MADRPKMTLEQFAKLFELELKVEGVFRRDGWESRPGKTVMWHASLRDTGYTRDDKMISSTTGFGDTPEEAIDACAAAIEDKLLIIQQYNKPRRELQVAVDFIPVTKPAAYVLA